MTASPVVGLCPVQLGAFRRVMGLLTRLRVSLFTKELKQEGPSQPLSPQGQSLAICVPGSLFLKHPPSSYIIIGHCSGPRSLGYESRQCRTKLTALFGILR